VTKDVVKHVRARDLSPGDMFVRDGEEHEIREKKVGRKWVIGRDETGKPLRFAINAPVSITRQAASTSAPQSATRKPAEAQNVRVTDVLHEALTSPHRGRMVLLVIDQAA
jgi:hypothetical protein